MRDYEVALAMSKQGNVDAFPTVESVLCAIVKQRGHPDDDVFLSDSTKPRNIGFALKKDVVGFREVVNRALLDVEAAGCLSLVVAVTPARIQAAGATWCRVRLTQIVCARTISATTTQKSVEERA
jgi:ABC-type amino acid transport substrate-binding protein